MKHKGKQGGKGKKKKNGYALVYDIIIIALGIFATIVLVKIGAIDAFIKTFKDYSVISSFVAGIFFTSTFTVAPAAVALVAIAGDTPTWIVAFWGALGAMFGDMVLFFFIRDRFADDLLNVIKPSKVKHFFHSLHFGFMKWLSPLLGAFIIASPLPDEFAVSLMGFSKVRAAILMPVSFIGNVAGIYLLVKFANLFL